MSAAAELNRDIVDRIRLNRAQRHLDAFLAFGSQHRHTDSLYFQSFVHQTICLPERAAGFLKILFREINHAHLSVKQEPHLIIGNARQIHTVHRLSAV